MQYIMISNMLCIIGVLYNPVILQRHVAVSYCLLDVLYINFAQPPHLG